MPTSNQSLMNTPKLLYLVPSVLTTCQRPDGQEKSVIERALRKLSLSARRV